MLLSGRLFDGHTSKSHPAELSVTDQGDVRIECPELSVSGCHWSELTISPRIGTTARYLDLPNGLRFETRDNDQVDQLIGQFAGDDRLSWIHRLENSYRYALLSVIGVGLFIWWGINYGLPSAARQVAFLLPVSVNEEVSKHTLSTLDKYIFEPSVLEAERREKLRKDFATLVASRDDGFNYQLHFRNGGIVGPNAFALPDGSIIFTDQIIELAGDDEELIAVMSHEIGHVNMRHGLRRALQSSALPLIIIVVTGDMSTASSVLAALPTILVESQYSQAFELEADAFAKDLLQQHQHDPMSLGRLLERLSEEHEAGTNDWFSSHPSTPERIEKLRD